MTIIHLLYVTAAMTAIGACLPQLRRLIETKQSDEFSMLTWVVWTGAQCVSTIYALSVGDMLYAVVSTAWFAFYSVMVALIIRYRRVPELAPVVESPDKA